MSKDLLKPRVICIADWPYMPKHIKIGGLVSDNFALKARQYPHLFKELEWWEERSDDDLPKYLKDVETGKVDKVARYSIGSRLPCFYTGETEKKGRWKGSETPFNLRAMIPATEAEYLSTNAQLEATGGSI